MLPCGSCLWEDALSGLFGGNYEAIDIKIDEKGNYEKFELCDWENWLNISQIPDPDAKFVRTVDHIIKVPQFVRCANYNENPMVDVGEVSKQKVFERDGYQCLYTGKKLKRQELSLDHVIPTSRGGKNTWENSATTSKRLNSLKSDHLLGEIPRKILDKMGVDELTLRYQPFKPKYREISGNLSKEQRAFLG